MTDDDEPLARRLDALEDALQGGEGPPVVITDTVVGEDGEVLGSREATINPFTDTVEAREEMHNHYAELAALGDE